MSVQTSTRVQTIAHMEKLNQFGYTDTANNIVGSETHARLLAEGFTIVTTWESWACTTCGVKTDNNPSSDDARYDLHTFLQGHAATR